VVLVVVPLLVLVLLVLVLVLLVLPMLHQSQPRRIALRTRTMASS